MPALDAWCIAVLPLERVFRGQLVVQLVCPSQSLYKVGSPSLALLEQTL